MPMMTSQILKSVDFTKTQKFRHLTNELVSFLQIKKNHELHTRGYFIAKNSFLPDVALKAFFILM